MGLFYVWLIFCGIVNISYAMDQKILYQKFTQKQQERLNKRLRALVQSGTPEQVAHIIQEGAHVNNIYEYDDNGKGTSYCALTPLMLAARSGNVKNMKVLLNCKADPHVATLMKIFENKFFTNALREAARYGKKECIELLLEYKADPFCVILKSLENTTYTSMPIIYESITRNAVECTRCMLDYAEKIDSDACFSRSVEEYLEYLPEVAAKKSLERDILFLLFSYKKSKVLSVLPKRVFLELIVRRSIKKHLVLSDVLKGCFDRINPKFWETKYVIYDETIELLTTYKSKVPLVFYDEVPLLSSSDNVLVKFVKSIKEKFTKNKK